MFRFEDPIYLWLLALLPVLVLLRLLVNHRQHKRLRSFGDKDLLRSLMPGYSRWHLEIKFWLMLLILALLIVMLARPQMGTKISREKRSGIETIIALDISNSMKSEDVAPSRLMKSKMLVENMVDNFTNDKVGLIAINMAVESFTKQDKIGRAIIVITDGEDHEGGAIEAAENALDKGMRVYVLGVGSTKGSPIPDDNGGYMKDNTGEVVMTSLNEQMCKDIARAGGGAYIHVDNTNIAQEQLDKELAKLQKGDLATVVYSEYDEQFQAFGIIIVLLLVIEIAISESKNLVFKNLKLFKQK